MTGRGARPPLTSSQLEANMPQPVIADLIRNLQAVACKPSSSQESRSNLICPNRDRHGLEISIMKIAGQARNDGRGARGAHRFSLKVWQHHIQMEEMR